MNRILTLMIVLLVLGIALSRTSDILMMLSPYETGAFTEAPTASRPAASGPVAADAVVEESELAGRTPL